MKFTLKFILVLLMCFSVELYSQTPFGVSYQAVIRNSSGQVLVDQNVVLKIMLTNGAGDPFYTEYHSVKTNAYGMVNVILGSGTDATGTYANVPWRDGDIYLKVDFKLASASTFTSFEKQKLQAVPYALYAADGLTLHWQGSLAAAPSSPKKNYAYYNTVDKKSYIYDGDSWELLTQDGAAVSWAGSLATNPTPALNKAYYNTTDKVSYIWDGDSWEILAKDGAPGPLVSGSAGQTLVNNGTTWVANGSIMVTDSSVNIVPKVGHDSTKPIFTVLNSTGAVVFAVYESGVRSYVGPDAKGAKGGFAIGGLSTQGKGTVEYMRITPDSTRFYVDEVATPKGAKGGFAIGGRSTQGKAGVVQYFRLDADSAIININDASKGAKGGFAIGGRSTQGKGDTKNYFEVTKDSTFFSNTILSTGDMLVAGTVETNVGIAETMLIDLDGNKYKTVKIGTQVWMAENLRTTKYSNGDPIEIDSVIVYNNSTNFDTITNYGRLYVLGAVESPKNLCPNGWRVPAFADWQSLFSFVGGMQWTSNATEVFNKLVEPGTIIAGTGFWNNNLFQTNTTGFSVRPGGEGEMSAQWMFFGMGMEAIYWSQGSTNVAKFDGTSVSGQIFLTEGALGRAYSVRCIKN